MIDLQGKVALVTGGSRGIGKATALRLAEAGADVIINYAKATSAAKETAEQIQGMGRRSTVVKADVSEPDDVDAMMEFVGDRFEHLDILVSNAASGGFRALTDSSRANFDAAFHTNVMALINLVRAGKDHLLASGKRSRVVALSSHGSRRALPHYGLIGSSKAALEALVRQFALELGPSGINFNVVLSGLVITASTKAMPGLEQLSAGVQQHMLTPDEALTPDAVANVITFLCSPMADLIQGQTVVVDAGADII